MSFVIREEPPLRWRREITRLDLLSKHTAHDGPDRFVITRNRRSKRIMLYVYRGVRKRITERYDYLPSVRYAKQLVEQRRWRQPSETMAPKENEWTW